MTTIFLLGKNVVGDSNTMNELLFLAVIGHQQLHKGSHTSLSQNILNYTFQE